MYYLKPYFLSVKKNGIRLLTEFFYPLKCLKCGVYIDSDTAVDPHTMEACFCDLCMAEGVFLIETPFCTLCGSLFHKSFNENHVCGACLKAPLHLARVRAATEYKGIMKDAIPLFKYHSKLCLAKVFEPLMFEAFLQNFADSGIDLILPIPLHKKKLRERGFNQAFLLTRNFVRLYQEAFGQLPPWKINTVSLARIKKTTPQTGLDISLRKSNLKNAFKVVKPETIENKTILLIDDVFTTGATCNEAARVLLGQGARKVDALVLARA